MTPKITVSNQYEFEQMIENKDFSISEAIVNSILANLNTRKKNINVLNIEFEDENEELNISVEKKYFLQTLEENLPHFIRNEKYEECQIINQTINKLKEQSKNHE